MSKGKARKDNKGRALRKGEGQRTEDLLYYYTFTDPLGRTKRIYAGTLMELRKKEDEIVKAQLDGLDVVSVKSLVFVGKISIWMRSGLISIIRFHI